jgi:signal transduction histidine kinase
MVENARGPDLSRGLGEALARSLRHEIGDFLQKVYASIAILQSRLPPGWDLEREILTSLRKRAEGCKNLLDAVQDFLCPMTVTKQELDLAALAASRAAAVQTRYPQVEVTTDLPGPARVMGDAERLNEVGLALLTNACEANAHHIRVAVHAEPGSHQAEWTVRDDGPGVPSDKVPRLFEPFFTTRTAHAGLGLALAKKTVLLHEGQITARNLQNGGFEVSIRLPAL